MNGVQILPLEGIPEVRPGDDLAAMLADALEGAGGLVDGDVVVVAQKVVSKAEGRVEQADDYLEVILREARSVRRRRRGSVCQERVSRRVAATPHR